MPIVFCLSAWAQTSSSTGAVEGWVYDASGGPIPAAYVLARSQNTGFSKAVNADDRGYFHVTNLPVGPYTLEVSQPGFSRFQDKALEISVGSTTRVDAHLQLAAQSQQITVNEPAPLLDPSQTSMTNSVGGERIEEAPVRTRNALDFVLLEPNVVSTPTSSGGTASSGLSGSGLSFGGMRPTSNRISIDGIENDDEFSGGSRTELSPEVVEEFQVVNNGISAESGGASGGQVNVVSRSGANAMHGDVFLFVQNGTLNARPPIEDAPVAPALTRYRAGLANGGAIVRDHTFYYAAVEQEHERSQASADIRPGIASTINAALGAGLYPAFPVRVLNTGFFPTARGETEASGKIDQIWNDRSVMSVRYALTNNREAGDAYNNGGLEDASSRGSSFLRDQSLASAWTFIVSPDTTNNFRTQVSERRAVLRTNEADGPEMMIDGLADFGQPYRGNLSYTERHADATDTVSWNRGAHLIQAGVALTYVHESAVNRDGQGGLFVFPTLADFLDGQPAIYRQMFDNPAATFSTPSYGAFFQDHWVVSRRLTVDAGIRYDFEQLPRGFPQDTLNFSPRVGVAFSPANRLVLRAGYGIFYDRYLLASLDQAIIGGMQGFEQVIEDARAASILGISLGASPGRPLAGVQRSIYRADPALATPYSNQASFGVQYAPAKDITASANYLHVDGVKLAHTSNVNLLPPPSPSEAAFSNERLNPAFNDIFQLEDSANSTYNGLSLALRVMKKDFTLDTSYTFSKATDDASTWMEQVQNPYALWQDNGLSLFDVRHRFVLSGLFDLPIGDEDHPASKANQGFWTKVFSNIELAPIFTAESGRPENPLTGIDNGSDAYPLSTRPIGLRRNSLQIPPLVSLDLRILKAIPMGESRHLDLVAESFNLLNHTNITAVNPFFGIRPAPGPWFTQPTDALAGRQFQFSIDFEF